MPALARLTRDRLTRARALAAIAAALAMVAAAALATPAAAQFVPNPTVIGPIPASVAPGDPSHDYPFLATQLDLASHGYVEEEYFIDGVARRYTTPSLATGSEIAGGQLPYRTRIVVRRPASASNFTGTVVLEWINVTAGYDIEIDWFVSNEHFLRSGWAWVGVSAQRVGAQALRTWSPVRYDSLNAPATSPADALSFDIFAQAAQAVRSPVGIAPLPGFNVERVIATGHSQSAGRLATYHNSIHPLHEITDAFVIHGSGSALRTDLSVKVMRLLSETDVSTQSPEPDSDHFRRWETAGTSHIGRKESAAYEPLIIRDRGSLSSRDCTRPPFSRIPYHQVQNAGYDHLERWMDGGAEPPMAPRLEWTSPTVKARDAFGNALGGIRLPQHEVATAVNTGSNSGPGFCFLFGSHEPFDQATLRSLYRNHGAYVSAIAHATNQIIADGFVLTPDADITREEAAESGFGKK